jgi:cardiolipin synthase
LDGFGSFSFPKEVADALRKWSSLSLFLSVLFGKLFYIGRRLHHKIVVADAHVLLIGGINIANKYHGKPGKNPGWITRYKSMIR